MISLDTNAVIAAINRRVPSIRPRLEIVLEPSSSKRS
jgi:hypothetical protein